MTLNQSVEKRKRYPLIIQLLSCSETCCYGIPPYESRRNFRDKVSFNILSHNIPESNVEFGAKFEKIALEVFKKRYDQTKLNEDTTK